MTHLLRSCVIAMAMIATLPIPAAAAVCGNGILERREQCDDGNLVAGDCCSRSCTTEVDGSPCDDGQVCTAGDSCHGGTCTGSGNPCSDGIGCTRDVCTEGASPQCESQPVDAMCDDGLFCTGAETCNVGTGCEQGALPAPDCSSLAAPCMIADCDEVARGCVARPNVQDPACGNVRTIAGESPSPLPVELRWLDDPAAGPLVRTGVVLAELSAVGSERTTVAISVIAAGLDQRIAERVIKPRMVAVPGRPRRIKIKLARLPVQSIGTSTSIELFATILREDGSTVVVGSEPIFVTFDDAAYRSATIRSAEDAAETLDRRSSHDYDAFAADVERVSSRLFQLQGRVFHDGRMVDIAAMPWPPADGWAPGGSAMLRMASGDRSSLPSKFDGLPQYQPGPNRRNVTICASWRAQYVDAGFGEDHLSEKYVQTTPARHALAAITRGAHSRLSRIRLDENGCTTRLLDPGKYSLWVWPLMEKDGTIMNADYQRYLPPDRCTWCGDNGCIETMEECLEPLECEEEPEGFGTGFRMCSPQLKAGPEAV